MILMSRTMKLIPTFFLLFCAFGLFVAPVSALADAISFSFDTSSYGFVNEVTLALSSSSSSFTSHDLGELGAQHVDVTTQHGSATFESAGQSTSTGSVHVSSTAPTYSVSLASDIGGNFYAHKQSDGDYTIDLGQSTALKTYWDYDGTLRPTGGTTSTGTTSSVSSSSGHGTIGGSTSVSSGTLGGQTVDVTSTGSETGSGSTFQRSLLNLADYVTGSPGTLSVNLIAHCDVPAGSAVYFNRSGNYVFCSDSDIFKSNPPSSVSCIGTFSVTSLRCLTSSGWVDVPYEGGIFVVPQDCTQILCELSFNLTFAYSGYFLLDYSSIVVQVPDGQTISAIETSTQQQTDTLMNTDGSDSIVSGATSGGEQGLLDKLGFIGTVIQVPLSILDGLTSSEESTITFPGISVPLPGGNFVIPETEIDLWANFPALETPVRTGCTFVCVLLWLNGCKSLYDRIVHGDQDVIIEEGSA